MSESVKEVIYEDNGTRYAVSKFSDEGKAAFSYMLEINQELLYFKKRRDILQAASITLVDKIKTQLTSDMIASLEDTNKDDKEAIN